MIPQILFGVITGFAATRFGSHWSDRCSVVDGHFRGFRHGRPRALFWLARKLDLDERQRTEVEGLFLQVREAMRAVRREASSGLDVLFDSFGTETFDRSRVEQFSSQKGESFDKARKELVNALARLHEILSPAQRERLRHLLNGSARARWVACH